MEAAQKRQMGKRRSVPRRLWALAYGQTELIGSIIFACSVNKVRSQVCKGVGNNALNSQACVVCN